MALYMRFLKFDFVIISLEKKHNLSKLQNRQYSWTT